MKFINDCNSQKFDEFRDIKLKKPHLRGLFFIESLKVYLKALDSKIRIIKTITTRDIYQEHESQFYIGEIITTTSEILNNLIKFKSHTKVFAIAEIPKEEINFQQRHCIF